jgi:gentisate 1,2-dioxygenase
MTTESTETAGITETPEITAEEEAALKQLYTDFASAGLIPLWTEIGNLMPLSP